MTGAHFFLRLTSKNTVTPPHITTHAATPAIAMPDAESGELLSSAGLSVLPAVSGAVLLPGSEDAAEVASVVSLAGESL